MHTVHLIALEYDPAVKLNDKAVTELLADALDGNSDWWDYYELGGRWEGYLDGRNFTTLVENPIKFEEILRSARAKQNSNFRRMRDEITGAAVAVADLEGHIFGLPVAQDEAVAARMTEANKESKAAWLRVLATDNLDDIDMDGNAMMALYRMRRLVNLADGRWNPDSIFYDCINGTANPTYLLQQVREEGEHHVVLAAVDFHF